MARGRGRLPGSDLDLVRRQRLDEYGVDYGILNSLGLLNCHERPELPALLWRFDKDWKGLWHEIPWVKEPPSTYVRRNFRVMSARAKRYCTATRPSSTR